MSRRERPVELSGVDLTDPDFQLFSLLVLIAGNETTRDVTSNGMIRLRHNRDQLAAWQQDLSLTHTGVEEVFEGLMSRIEDIELREPPRRLRSHFINGVKEMQVTFKPGPKVE